MTLALSLFENEIGRVGSDVVSLQTKEKSEPGFLFRQHYRMYLKPGKILLM